MAQCEQSWAGRFVIGLQLLSWCAVGAILLHRGFSSIQLHKESHPGQANLTALEATPAGTNTTNATNAAWPTSQLIETTVHRDSSSSAHDLHTGNVNTISAGDANADGELATVRPAPGAAKTPTHVHNVRVPPPTTPPATPTPPKKKYDLTPSGLVMVALGAIMLVVGPSVVILRCCDPAGHGRRFNKLSVNDPALTLADLDLPPPYEDVADVDADADAEAGRAPRYSMIFPDEFADEEIRRA